MPWDGAQDCVRSQGQDEFSLCLSWFVPFVPDVVAFSRPGRCRQNEPVFIVVIGRYPIQFNNAAGFVCLCHVERSHFPALLTFAQRARCAAAILLRPAALIVLRLPRFADTPPTPWSALIAASIRPRSASSCLTISVRFVMRGILARV